MAPDQGPPDMPQPAAWIAAIEFVGALLIVGYCVGGVIELVRTRDPATVRLLVIQGSLWGLSLKTAAALLKTIELRNWQQIAAFAAILALRTLLKRVMTWEQRHLRAPPRTPAPHPRRSGRGAAAAP